MKNTILTVEERKDLSHVIYANVEDIIIKLYSRWLDEKEYEDIKDYAAPIKAIIEPLGATFIKMNKRPFGFEFTLKCAIDTPNGSTYQVFIKSGIYGFKRTK